MAWKRFDKGWALLVLMLLLAGIGFALAVFLHETLPERLDWIGTVTAYLFPFVAFVPAVILIDAVREKLRRSLPITDPNTTPPTPPANPPTPAPQ